jgi:hypothetical protein
MTDSDVRTGRPPDAPPPGPEWKKIPGVKDYYEFSHRGLVRSLDHTTNGRFYEGRDPLKPRLDPYGYEVVNITLADGTRKHGVSVARLVLLAHAGEPPDPGMQACHGPGGQRDNRWPEAIRWDDDQANRDDRWESHPPKPKPLKVCVMCGAGFDTPGRRCHPCVVEISAAAARLIADKPRGGGMDPEEAAKELDYPSAVGLFRLAKKYGGLRCTVEPVLLIEEVNAAMRELGAGHPPSWLRRVTAGRFKRGDAP